MKRVLNDFQCLEAEEYFLPEEIDTKEGHRGKYDIPKNQRSIL